MIGLIFFYSICHFEWWVCFISMKFLFFRECPCHHSHCNVIDLIVQLNAGHSYMYHVVALDS